MPRSMRLVLCVCLVTSFTSLVGAQSDETETTATFVNDTSTTSSDVFVPTDVSTSIESIFSTESVLQTDTVIPSAESSVGLTADPTASATDSPTIASSAPVASSTTGTESVGDTVPEADYKVPDNYVSTPPEAYTDNNLSTDRKNHGNPKPVVLSTNDSINLANMEGDFYTYFAENEPVPGVATIKIPDVACNGQSSSRLARRRTRCKTYTSININVYFHYVWNGKASRKSKSDWESRVDVQMTFLKSVFDPIGIYFTYMPSIEYLKGKFSDNILEDEAARLKVLNNFHLGGNDDLNVFLVESITSTENKDPTIRYNGYSNILISEDLNGDGIIMDQARLGDELQNTLVHETGHWLGLEHTFGDAGSLCTLDDGLLDTTRTSGARATIFECYQKPCDSETEARINNWMSYSSCAGTDISGATTSSAFTTDQKARMFARQLKYRQGISNACQKEPRTVSPELLSGSTPLSSRSSPNPLYARADAATLPPSSMQNLRDGTCPQPDDPIPGTVHATPGGPEDTDSKSPDSGSAGVTGSGTVAPGASSTGSAGAAGTSESAAGALAVVGRGVWSLLGLWGVVLGVL